MKVSMWYNNNDIRLEDIPTPSPDQGEMLVKVISCGICGSDIVEWYRLPRAPLVQGHEVGVEVIEVGQGVSQYKKGNRLFIAPKVACLKCRYCLNGHYPQCNEIKDRLPGGIADNAPSSDFDPKQLAKGIEIEMEHVNDKELAEENIRFKSSQRIKWFLAGGMVLLCGLIFGLLLGSRKKSYRSSY